MPIAAYRSYLPKFPKGYSVNRTSRKILVRLAVMTTASSGLFSSGPLKWIPQSSLCAGHGFAGVAIGAKLIIP